MAESVSRTRAEIQINETYQRDIPGTWAGSDSFRTLCKVKMQDTCSELIEALRIEMATETLGCEFGSQELT